MKRFLEDRMLKPSRGRYIFVSETSEFSLRFASEASECSSDGIRGLQTAQGEKAGTSDVNRYSTRCVFRAPSFCSSAGGSEDEEEAPHAGDAYAEFENDSIVTNARKIESDIQMFEKKEIDFGFAAKDCVVNIQQDLKQQRNEKVVAEIGNLVHRMSLKKRQLGFSAELDRRGSGGQVLGSASHERLRELKKLRDLESTLSQDSDCSLLAYENHVGKTLNEQKKRLNAYRMQRLAFERVQAEKLVGQLFGDIEKKCGEASAIVSSQVVPLLSEFEQYLASNLEKLLYDGGAASTEGKLDSVQDIPGTQSHVEWIKTCWGKYKSVAKEGEDLLQAIKVNIQFCNQASSMPVDVSTVKKLEAKILECDELLGKAKGIESQYCGANWESAKNSLLKNTTALIALFDEWKKKKNEEDKQSPAPAVTPAAAKPTIVSAKSTENKSSPDPSQKESGSVKELVDVLTLTKNAYDEHNKFVESKMAEMGAWLKDKSFGRQRIDCKKKVNTNINTISATIPQVLHKIENLNALLRIVKENQMGYIFTKGLFWSFLLILSIVFVFCSSNCFRLLFGVV